MCTSNIHSSLSLFFADHFVQTWSRLLLALPGVQKPPSSFPGAFGMLFKDYILRDVAGDGSTSNCHLTHGEDVCTALLIFCDSAMLPASGHFSK